MGRREGICLGAFGRGTQRFPTLRLFWLARDTALCSAATLRDFSSARPSLASSSASCRCLFFTVASSSSLFRFSTDVTLSLSSWICSNVLQPVSSPPTLFNLR